MILTTLYLTRKDNLLTHLNDIKLSFGMIVVNGEPFIKYNLETLYPHAHEILIVEGAVEKFSHSATSDGHSIDNTISIIKNFPDPEGKIKLIQRNGFWSEKDDMANAYMEVCTGDYIWQVDVDEFYKTQDIEKVRDMLVADRSITQVNFRTIGFWRSFRARIMGASFVFGADEFIRLFVFKPGFRYVTHRPPTLSDETGRPFLHTKVVSASEMEQAGIVQYHYSYVFPDGVKSKSHYYSQMGWGNGCEDGLRWAEHSWATLDDPLRIHLIDFPPSWIEPFNGEHPAVIIKMIQDILYSEDVEIADFLKEDWHKFALVGRYIGDICRQVRAGHISNIQSFIKILATLFFPVNKRVFNADKMIVKAAFKNLTTD